MKQCKRCNTSFDEWSAKSMGQKYEFQRCLDCRNAIKAQQTAQNAPNDALRNGQFQAPQGYPQAASPTLQANQDPQGLGLVMDSLVNVDKRLDEISKRLDGMSEYLLKKFKEMEDLIYKAAPK